MGDNGLLQFSHDWYVEVTSQIDFLKGKYGASFDVLGKFEKSISNTFSTSFQIFQVDIKTGSTYCL